MDNIRLTRSENDKLIAGVCGGLAAYMNIDPVIVRVLFALLFFASGIGVPIYLILWFIMPRQSDDPYGEEGLGSNFDEVGDNVTDGVNRLGRPGTIGTIFIMLGAYFLLSEVGILGWLGNGFIWPLIIIGVGVYFYTRRNDNVIEEKEPNEQTYD